MRPGRGRHGEPLLAAETAVRGERQWAAELRYADCVTRINADKNQKS